MEPAPHKNTALLWSDIETPALVRLSDIGCDGFECALLPMVRDLTITCLEPECQSWIPVYNKAHDLWGPRTGLPLVNTLAQIVVALIRVRGAQLNVLHSRKDRQDAFVTQDEQCFLLALHHFRRQHQNAAGDFLLELTGGLYDRELWWQCLAFGQRHSCGEALPRHADEGRFTGLHVVR